ncbi:cell division protein ZipA [Halomonas heilongjiangensis]|uniref:Cell division protein ZipA n=1 Tax=Halomonas heilongjiangensis TaxID=1387883 RepID=A0A2N7TLK2_9GAMM|nr:cell division protein ZipA [Halomonas heilongjiangensis]PMR69060.1 cell division protein ZipA [Halomonas heilongjiangensis]PXX91344.1 cell division protein ZipA [Halomonas heilongjiangensis]
MELREWLIILGLALVTLIVIDGVRRLQRQRRIPRLDEVEGDARGQDLDPEAAAREAEINWELPNGGARVVRPADYSGMQPMPKLERREHPGPSRVLAGFKANAGEEATAQPRSSAEAVSPTPPASRAEPAGDASAAHRDQAPTPQVAPEAIAPAGDERVQEERNEQARKKQQDAKHEAVSAAGSNAAATESAEARSPDRRHAAAAVSEATQAEPSEPAGVERREPSLSALEDEVSMASVAGPEPLAADPEDHDDHQDAERYRLVDLDGMSDSIKSGTLRVGASMQRFGASLQKSIAERREQKRLEKQRREQERAEKAARDAEQRRQAEEAKAAREEERRRLEAEAIAEADDDDPLFAPSRLRDTEALPSEAYASREPDGDAVVRDAPGDEAVVHEEPFRQSDVVRAHPVLEKALRHDVSAEHARHALSHAEEIIVISVMSRDEQGFSGTALLDLMLACGLRYSRDMGIFHRFETEDPESQLQFSMVNVLKPGTFPIEAMGDFRTPGVTLLMPLPGASDTAAAFEAMVETAMVVVRHLGGELKDENQSVMTAQTVGFARQRVQEFERRNRLNRYQVN